MGLKEGREEAEKQAKKVQEKLVKEAKEQREKAKEQREKAKEQREKAKEQREKGIKNLLNLDILTDKQIAESLDVSTYLVRKIKKQMKNEKDS